MIKQPVELDGAASERPKTERPKAEHQTLRNLLALALLLVTAGSVIISSLQSPQAQFFAYERFQTLVTIFLGIFIEAVPFLLLGSIVSGFVDVFVDRSLLERLVPRNPVLAALSGSVLGLAFPVCECGVVPVTRRLYEKGLPLSVGIAFLLAAPVINPVVILSTAAAFGWGPVLWARIGGTIVIAFIVGMIFLVARPQEVLRTDVMAERSFVPVTPPPSRGLLPRIGQSFVTAGDDFLDMVRFLIAGSLLAAAMQTLIPQSALLAIGQGVIVSVLVLMVLAYVLSVCSTVDAFLALAFSNTFTTGAVIGFLTFGPMVDVKSSLMFLGVFQRRTVLYLILLPFALSAVYGTLWNVYIGG